MSSDRVKDPQEGERRKRGRTFNFSFSFGRKPPVDDPEYQRLLEEAMRQAESSPDGTGAAAETADVYKLDFSDGELRVRHTSGPTGEDMPPTAELPASPPDAARDAEAWERLSRIGAGAYPDTAAMHRVLRRFVLALGLGVPVVLLILGLATGQSFETVFFMTLFGLIVGVMFITTMPGR